MINIHFPKNPAIINKAVQRLKFEELLFVQLELLLQKKILKEKVAGHFLKSGRLFQHLLPRASSF